MKNVPQNSGYPYPSEDEFVGSFSGVDIYEYLAKTGRTAGRPIEKRSFVTWDADGLSFTMGFIEKRPNCLTESFEKAWNAFDEFKESLKDPSVSPNAKRAI